VSGRNTRTRTNVTPRDLSTAAESQKLCVKLVRGVHAGAVLRCQALITQRRIKGRVEHQGPGQVMRICRSASRVFGEVTLSLNVAKSCAICLRVRHSRRIPSNALRAIMLTSRHVIKVEGSGHLSETVRHTDLAGFGEAHVHGTEERIARLDGQPRRCGAAAAEGFSEE
jgi:hypothetical protein